MVIGRVVVRKVPLVVTLLVVSSGMLFSLFWLKLTQPGFYGGFWLTPGDLWASYRTAHWVGWGAYGSLYSSTGVYLTFPGLAILLAPVALLTRAFGMTEGFPLFIPHPSAWLILGPLEMLLGCMSLFALDSLSERLGLAPSKRAITCVVQGVLIWPLLVLWGHPEDAIALALAVYALKDLLDDRHRRSAWLFGGAVAFQPLVLLLLPLCLVRTGWRECPRFLGRSLGPSIALLAAPVMLDWHDTWNAVVRQPQQLALAHITPWTALAPHVAAGIVSSGPTRLVAVIVSIVLSCVIVRRGTGEHALLYCAALCLALRFVTESTLEGYYIWPALAFFVLVAGTLDTTKFASVCLFAVGLTVATARHFGPWWFWWAVPVCGLVLAAFGSHPSIANLKGSPDLEPTVIAPERWDPTTGDGQVLVSPQRQPRVLETA